MRRLLLAAFLLSLLLAGCGGGGGGSPAKTARRGSATITVVWPGASRTVPANAAKVTLSVSDASGKAVTFQARDAGGGLVSATSLDVARGTSATSTAILYGLAPNAYVVGASAYAAAGGAALAGGSAPVTIAAGASTPFTIDMSTTLGRVMVVDGGGGLSASGQAVPLGFATTPFYVTASGGLYADSAETQPLASVGYVATTVRSTFAIVPQSFVNGAWSDLFLIPVSGTSPFSVAAGAGFATPTVETPTQSDRLTVDLTNLQTATASSLEIDYAEEGALQDAFRVPLAFTAGQSSALSASVVGLPSDFDPSLFTVAATLTETPSASGGDGTVFAGAWTSSSPGTVTFGSASQQVVNHGRPFTLAATLRVATVGGGFVDLVTVTQPGVAFGSVGTSALDLSTATPPTVAVVSTDLPRDGIVRGQAYDFGLKVRLNDNDPPVTLPASLFKFTFANSDVVVANGQVTADPSLTASPTSDSPTSLAFPYSSAPPVVPTGVVTILVKPNGGYVGVGVN